VILVLKRLWVLTLLQLSNKMKLKMGNRKRFLASLGLKLLSLIVITVVMIFMLYFINNILQISVNVYFVIFFLFFTQMAGVLACTSGLMTDLYLSKDNQILLAYPARHNEVFLSKLLVFYVNEFLKNLYFLIPLLIAFGYISQQPFTYYFNILSMVFVLPLLPVLAASLISIPLTYVQKFLQDKNWAKLLLVIVAFLGAFVLLTLLLATVKTPIRIVALYHRFTTGVEMFMQASASYALVYTNIGKLLFGFKVLENYGILFAVIAGLILLVALTSRPLYFRLACKSFEQSVKKIHKGENKVRKNLFWTFVNKEWTLSRRNLGEMLENYILIILFPFLMAALNFLFLSIQRSSFGNNAVMALDIMISLLLVTASNSASASAITVEGFEFVLVKMAPSDTKRMCWAKILFNLLFSTLIILISFLIFNYALPDLSLLLNDLLLDWGIGGQRYPLPRFADLDIWLTFTVVVLVNAGHILWSFQIDLLSPKLSDYASTGSLSNNPNISKSITIGIVLSVLFGIGAALLLIEDYSTGWIRIVLLALAFFLARLYLFINHVKYYFGDIEF
jgi:ABC-2 type transport system permease protein